MVPTPQWWPSLYAEACRRLDIDPERDRRAAHELAEALFSRATPRVQRAVRSEAAWHALRRHLAGRRVAVLGGAPRLPRDLALAHEDSVLVTTGGALPLLPPTLVPDLLVTDLDGDPDLHRRCSALGVLTVAHAHADNAAERSKLLASLEGPVAGSSQPEPHPGLLFAGGFTDGDRAAALAAAAGADTIQVLGFDPVPPPGHRDPARKQVKLEIARRVLVALRDSGVRLEDPGGFLQG